MKRLILIGALAFPTLAQAQSQADVDKGFITELIEDNLSGDTRIVNIVGFAGALSSAATMQQLTVADSDGVWLTLDDVTLDWNRSALLRGAIDVQELSAAKITVARAPLPDTSVDLPDAEATPFALPELPVSINLESLNIAEIALADVFLGEPVTISLTGNASLSGGEGTANVEAVRLDDRSGRFVIDGSYSNSSKVLALDLNLAEAADGIIARLLDLPGKPSVALDLDGTGPLSDYAATLTLATDNTERLAGDLTLTQSDAGQAFALDVGGDVTSLFAPEYQDFFGPDVSLVAAGIAAAEGGFDLSELTLSAQHVTLNGTLRTDANGLPEVVALTGEIKDPTGDAVLLPLAGDPTFVQSMDLDVAYDRQLSDGWTAAFDIADLARPGLAIDAVRLNGSGTLVAGDAPAVAASFTYGATGLTLDDIGMAEALGDVISGDLQINYQDGTPTRIDRLTLSGPGIELTANAEILGADKGLRTTSDVTLTVDTLTRFATLTGLDLSGAARLDIASVISPFDGFYEIALDGDTQDLGTGIAEVDGLISGAGTLALQAERDTSGTRLNTLRIATSAAEITANADVTSIATNAAFAANIVDLRDILDGVDGPAQLTGTAQQTPGGPLNFTVKGVAPDLGLTAQGVLRDDVNLTASGSFDIAKLATYNGITGQTLRGAAKLDVQAKAVTDGSLFDVTLNGQTVDLQTGIAQLDPVLKGQGAVALHAQRLGPEAFALNDLRIATPAAEITANAARSEGTTDATFDVSLFDTGLVLDGTSGPANIKGTAQQTPSGSLVFDVTGDAPDLTLTAKGLLVDNTDLTATATVNATDLATYNALSGQRLGGGVTLALDVDAVTDGATFDVTLTGQTRDLQSGIAQLDPLLAGAGTLAANAVHSGPDSFALNDFRIATPAMRITGSGAGGPSGPLNAVAEIALTDIGRIAPGLSGPMTANITANRDDAGATDVDLTANAPGANVTVDAQIAPDLLVSGNAKATVASLAPYQRLIGQPVRGGFDGVVVGTFRPDLSDLNTEITLRTQDIGIGNPSVDQLLRGTGRLSANIARSGAGLNIRNLSAVTNNISLTATLNGTESGGSGQFNARLRDIGLFTDQLSGPVTAVGTASRSGSTWGVDVDATGPGGIGAQLNGTATDSGNLNMRVTGNAPLGLANDVIAPRRLSGDATFNAAINGPPALSSVSGRVNIAGARLAAPTLGQSIEDITGFVSLAASRADINITGNLQGGGQLAISGPVALASPNNADFAVSLRNVILKDPTLYESSVDGTITLRGPLTGGALIAGTLGLGPSEIQVPSSSLSALGELPNVVHFGESAPVRQTLNRADVNASAGTNSTRAAAGPAYPLDITINAPSRIFIRGRGLDAELGGSLNLGGTTANVIPVGRFSLIRGRLDILQQRFDLTEGTASLQGDFEPYIRLVASTETSTGTVINIVVEGPASAPDVTFQSTPELPQDEVLSQLIFGRNLSEISPLQAVQLAAAVSTLAGNSGGGLIDDFRQNLGLDDFDVTTDDEGNAAVRAGAYLSENVYTDVTVSSDGSTEVNINLDITDDITAKGTVDADGETSIGIFFEKDY